jgi:hypothetical protein
MPTIVSPSVIVPGSGRGGFEPHGTGYVKPRDRLITGFRVGDAVFSAEHVDAAKTHHMLVNVAGSRPARHAALRALRETGPGFYVPARFEGLPGTMANATALIEEAGRTRSIPSAPAASTRTYELITLDS